MFDVVTIIEGQVALIRVHGDGSREVWLYDRGEAGGFLLPACGRKMQLEIEWGTAPVWESSDLQAQARQIANYGGGRAIIDEADVEAWAVRAQVWAAEEEAERYEEYRSSVGQAEAESRAQEEREADEARADAAAE